MGANGLLNQKVDGVFRYNYRLIPDADKLGNRKQEAQPDNFYGLAAILEVQIQIGFRDLSR